jgi:hypothetical protein
MAEKGALWPAKLAGLTEKRETLAKRKDAVAKAALKRVDTTMQRIEAGIQNSGELLASDDA